MIEMKKIPMFERTQILIRQLTWFAMKLAIIILLGVGAWRLAWVSFNIDLSNFEFSDLLAMILALFAVGMSVAFYFKTTDSSNQFYDNIYNFTQKTSEILGRIEERFGERLKHLDEGYGRMQSHFEGLAQSSDEITKEVEEKKGKEEEVKDDLKAVLKERNSLIEELSQRAYRQDAERSEFMRKMTELETKREEAESKIHKIEVERDQLQQQLMRVEMDMMEGMPKNFIEYLLHNPDIHKLIASDYPPETLQKYAQKLFLDFPEEIMARLRNAGIVNAKGELTSAGALMLRSMRRRFR